MSYASTALIGKVVMGRSPSRPWSGGPLSSGFVTVLLALVFLAGRSPSAQAQPDYSQAIWNQAAAGHWYTSGNSHSFCVIHDMEGYYLTTISYFQQSGTQASVHYCINSQQNGSDSQGHAENNPSDHPSGEITQMVREQYWAWHVLCWNTYTLGTEHEGFVSSPVWYTEAMYQASAGLQRHMCDAWGIPKDRNHIIGHNEWQNSAWTSWMAANWPAVDTTCNNHTDPGQYWDWNHFMALITGAPSAPSNLALTPLSTNQIKLSWTDTATNETGFKIERATASNGPWSLVGTTAADITVYTNGGLTASTVYFFRVKSYNANGDSGYSNVRSATTANAAPILSAIGSRTVNELAPLTFTATATDAGLGAIIPITDFESYAAGTTDVMFRHPSLSGSTGAFLDSTATNYTTVTATFPAGHSSSRVLRSNWTFTNGPANAWLRLTTSSASGIPNPVIDFRQVLKFDIYSDRTLRVGIGCRETTNAAGTAIGSDGGSSSATIEWVGVTNVVSGQPAPTRTVTAGSWQTLSFNIPVEPIRGFNGNGVLTTASGLGVLEHLALVPINNSGGVYNVYLDNFSVVNSNNLTFTLDAGAPAGATIDPRTGVFTWTPTEAQGPGVYDITVRVTDNGTPALSDSETFSVMVNEVNSAPVLAAVPDRTIYAGDVLTITNSATDPDIPANQFTFTLDPGAPAGASETSDGIFTFASTNGASGTNSFTVRVTDDGIPALDSARSFSVVILPWNITATIEPSGTNVVIAWNSVPGRTYRVQYKNGLEETNWHDITPDVSATGSTAFVMDPISPPGRYYRVWKPN